MKKSILIFCTGLITFSLAALGYVNLTNTGSDPRELSLNETVNVQNDAQNIVHKIVGPGFFYDVSSRFNTTIAKEKLHNAKSVADLVPKKSTNGVESFRDVKIILLPRGEEIFEKGESNVLNSAQLILLQSIDYSANFCIEAFCKKKNSETGKIEEQCFVYYVTVIPEKEAKYKGGHAALLDYLKENSIEETANVEEDVLEPGKVSFTVTKNGEISNEDLESTSGYTTVDKTMIKLITRLPGKWNPATNSNGENVDQELVFSFGVIGC